MNTVLLVNATIGFSEKASGRSPRGYECDNLHPKRNLCGFNDFIHLDSCSVTMLLLFQVPTYAKAEPG